MADTVISLASWARDSLTSTLAAHGVAGSGYARCTDTIYREVLGSTKQAICAAMGAPVNANARELLTLEQRLRVALAEVLASRNICRRNARGLDQCLIECQIAARKVAAVS